MKEFRQPARADSSVEIGPYTFTNHLDEVVNLTPYASVVCHVKRRGALYAVVAAAFVSQVGGTVNVASYEFADDGVWQVQFIAVKSSGQKLNGEPVQFRVVKNVVDAGLTELLIY